MKFMKHLTALTIATTLGLTMIGCSSGPADEPINKEEMAGKGDSIQSGDFEVTLKKWYVSRRVNTGNMFSNLKPEEGHLYLVLRASYKNTGSDSSVIWGSGKVLIDVDGKRYTYDNAETVLADGWGNMLESINPMVTKTTNLVFKIPQGLQGDVYWSAGQSWNEDTFYLGKL